MIGLKPAAGLRRPPAPSVDIDEREVARQHAVRAARIGSQGAARHSLHPVREVRIEGASWRGMCEQPGRGHAGQRLVTPRTRDATAASSTSSSALSSAAATTSATAAAAAAAAAA